MASTVFNEDFEAVNTSWEDNSKAKDYSNTEADTVYISYNIL